MKILAINPNTTEAMTDAVLAGLRAQACEGLTFEGATARRGTQVVASRASYAIAAVSVLEIWARYRSRPDAILIACFGDPGASALRELTDVPVLGLAEAAMEIASRRHGRFMVVTAGPCWEPIIDELAASCRIDGYLGTIAIDATGLSARSEPAAFRRKMQSAISDAERRGAEAILLGGAALAGMAGDYQCAVPLLDCVALAAERLATVIAPCATVLRPPAVLSVGLDADLANLLARPPA